MISNASGFSVMRLLHNPVLVLLLTGTAIQPGWRTGHYLCGALDDYTCSGIRLHVKQGTANGTGVHHAPVSPHCSEAEYRQFDFWIGDWKVFDSDKPDREVAHARISRILDGCVLLEDYTGNDGTHGQSFNIYDASTGNWRQTWVTNRGQFLFLNGNASGKKMVLSGSDLTADRRERQVRGTWQPISGGVREFAFRSTDGGRTWALWFHIVFRPSQK
jgi:hypothetical protein